jgi:thiosulfate/3-mercaptopyruvate sulfurtransferase
MGLPDATLVPGANMKPVLLAIMLPLGISLAQDPTLIQPKDLAARLGSKAARPPVLLHVGFNVLYRNRHIPGSIYAGPGSRPEGLAALKQAVAALPHTREIVLYCGCCPWDHCPNVKPALALLRQMGFTRVKALFIPTDIAADWTNKGYPVEAGTALK